MAPRIAVVGGGAGGVEIALAVQFRLKSLLKSGTPFTVTLLSRGKILPSHPARARTLVLAAAKKAGVQVRALRRVPAAAYHA